MWTCFSIRKKREESEEKKDKRERRITGTHLRRTSYFRLTESQIWIKVKCCYKVRKRRYLSVFCHPEEALNVARIYLLRCAHFVSCKTLLTCPELVICYRYSVIWRLKVWWKQKWIYAGSNHKLHKTFRKIFWIPFWVKT